MIYRRYNISLALKQNGFITGVNLWIWYGYADNKSKKYDFIAHTSVIKEDMKTDLKEYDHLCVEIHDSNDIVDSMIEIGKMVFKKASSHPLLYEIIVEDIYGDEVVVRNNQLVVNKKYLYNRSSNQVVFFCRDRQRRSLYGLPFESYIFTGKANITEKQLQKFMNHANNDMQYYVSNEDYVSSTVLTHNQKGGTPEYITVCCIDHIAHQLPKISISGKCAQLHGHTYRCYATIENSDKVSVTSEYICSIGEKVRNYLRCAFGFGGLKATTAENIIWYIADKLRYEHEVTFLELSETPNIKARIYK